MKIALQTLFLCFYVASGYAVTQERTFLVLEEVQQSSKHDQDQVEESPFLTGFPNYREAKPKAGPAVYFRHTEAVHFLLHISTRAPEPQPASFKSLFSLESISFRAPPVPMLTLE